MAVRKRTVLFPSGGMIRTEENVEGREEGVFCPPSP